MSSRRRINKARLAARANQPLVDLDALASNVRPSDSPAPPTDTSDQPAPGPPPRRARPPQSQNLESSASESKSTEGPPPRRGAVKTPTSAIDQPQPVQGESEHIEHSDNRSELPRGHSPEWRRREAQNQEQNEELKQVEDTPHDWELNQPSWQQHQDQQHQYHQQLSANEQQQEHAQEDHSSLPRGNPPFDVPWDDNQNTDLNQHQPPQHGNFSHHGSLPLPPDEDIQDDDGSGWDAYTNIELEESQQLQAAQAEKEHGDETQNSYEPQDQQYWQHKAAHQDNWDQAGENQAPEEANEKDPWDQDDDLGDDPWDQDVNLDAEQNDAWDPEAGHPPQEEQHNQWDQEAEQVAHEEQHEPWDQHAEQPAQEEQHEPWDREATQPPHQEQHDPWDQEAAPEHANEAQWDGYNEPTDHAWDPEAVNESEQQAPWDHEAHADNAWNPNGEPEAPEDPWDENAAIEANEDPWDQQTPYDGEIEEDVRAGFDQERTDENVNYEQQLDQQFQHEESHQHLDDEPLPWDSNQADEPNEYPFEHEQQAPLEGQHEEPFNLDNFQSESNHEAPQHGYDSQADNVAEPDSQFFDELAPQPATHDEQEQLQDFWTNGESKQLQTEGQPQKDEAGLDSMLGDDDFLGESESPDPQPLDEPQHAHYDTVIHHGVEQAQEADESLNNKLRALEMLDMDEDLLLDEEFLEDEEQITQPTQANVQQPSQQATQPAQQAAPQVTTQTQKQSSKYAPTLKYAPTTAPAPGGNPYAPKDVEQPKSGLVTAVKPSGPTIEPRKPAVAEVAAHAPTIPKAEDKIKEQLNAAKKKNDAYDFPMGLVKPPTRAPRAAAKLNPSSVTSPSVNQAGMAPPGNERVSSITSPNVTSTSLSPAAPPVKKNFFEEYPPNAIKPSSRPGRAAASSYTPQPSNEDPNASLRNASSPSASRALPAKSPKNPYAALQPKNSQTVAHIPQPVIGNVPPGPNKYQPNTQAPPGMSPQVNTVPIGRPPQGGFVPPPQGYQGVPPPQGHPGVPPQGHLLQLAAPPQNHGAQPFPNLGGRPQEPTQVQKSPRMSVNTAMQGKHPEKGASLSPYVPVTGPYAPGARGHSRTSSIVGGKAKEGNPYAPVQGGQGGPPPTQQHAKGAVPPPGFHGTRARGASLNRKSNPKVQNPAALLERQFPIFHWNSSQNVAFMIPHQPVSSFDPLIRKIQVEKVSDVASKHNLYNDFPGPLVKGKVKKKDMELWLQKVITSTEAENPASDEVVLAKILLLLVKFDGNFRNEELLLEVAKVLTPNVDYNQETPAASMSVGGQAISANAYKLDNQGINSVWSLIQTGKTEEALSIAMSKGDWALSFIIASSIGQERFAKVASDYARISFPFQKGLIAKVQHLMPILMKIFVGNSAGVISDFENVATEGEFARMYYKEILAAAIVNNCNTNFLVDFGNFLSNSGMTTASELCFIIGGLVMTPSPLTNGASFQAVGVFTLTSVYSEIYEYILLVSPATLNTIPPSGLPHLLLFKLRRAQTLADFGCFTEARRYCDLIGSTIRTLGKSPYVSPGLTHEFQELLIRLSNSGASDSSWLGAKLRSRVNMDKMWGHLDKIIGGEDSTPKPQDTGVFRNYSPSLSRNTSTLDVTQHLPNGTQIRPDLNRTASLASAPAGHTDFSPVQPQSRASTLRYAPGGSGSYKKAPSLLGQSSFQLGLPQHPTHKRVPSNGSLPNVALDPSPVNEDPKPALKQTSSFAPRQPTVPRNPLYSNRSGQVSALSIVSSHVSPQQNQQRHNDQHERFELPDLDVNNEHPVMERSPRGLEKGHFRTSLLQSEVQDGIDGNEDNHVPDTIEEKSEESSSQRPSRGELLPKKAEAEPEPEPEPTPPEETEGKDEPKKDDAVAPPPPISTKKSLPQRANPYAPGGSRGQARGSNSNRYGPGKTASKYASPNPSQHKDFLEKSTPNVSTNEVLGHDQNGDAEKEASKAEEEKEKEGEEEEASSGPLPHEPASQAPPARGPPPRNGPSKSSGPPGRRANPYAPASRNPYAPPGEQTKQPEKTNSKPPANVDISVDYDADESVDTSEDTKPPMPGRVVSPSARADYANPFQHEKAPVEGGLEDFSIPGSPEYTTRANSVIGHNGLFSSKLSQSQQSVMYQQYEVKDDTVHDYVPVPEDEEDEEEKRIKKRKEESAAAAQQNEARRPAQESEGWLSRLRGRKQDDKPKPIKAKLGQESTFYYDDELKRWIDKSRPLEEQIKELAPPPPPMKKKVAPKAAPKASSPEAGKPPAPSENNSEAPSAAKGPTPRAARAAPRGNLANANLDDLLSLSSGAPAGGRKQKRRYVNVLEKK